MIDTTKIIVGMLFLALCGVLGWYGRASRAGGGTVNNNTMFDYPVTPAPVQPPITPPVNPIVPPTTPVTPPTTPVTPPTTPVTPPTNPVTPPATATSGYGYYGYY